MLNGLKDGGRVGKPAADTAEGRVIQVKSPAVNSFGYVSETNRPFRSTRRCFIPGCGSSVIREAPSPDHAAARCGCRSGARCCLLLWSWAAASPISSNSMFSRGRDAAIRPNATGHQSVAEDRDLAAAREAVSEALAKGGRDASVPWEDPSTGARGTVTPLSNSHTQHGTTCRDFLASYVRNGSESWLQGEACRGLQGRWEVRHMRPWRRT